MISMKTDVQEYAGVYGGHVGVCGGHVEAHTLKAELVNYTMHIFMYECIFSKGDLLGQSWFDILHPKDVAKGTFFFKKSD